MSSVFPHIKLNIRGKLLIVLLFLIVGALAFTNVLWISSVRPLVHESIVDTQGRLAKNIAFRINEFVRAKVRNLVVRSQTTAFLDKNLQAVQAELEIILKQDDDLREISFIDEDGQELVKLTPERVFEQDELVNQWDSDKFIIPTFRHGIEYLGPVYFAQDGNPMITISVPIVIPITRKHIEEISTGEPIIQRKQGEIFGVLSAEASLENILRSVAAFDVGEEGYVYVVDKAGQLIVHPEQDFVQQYTDIGQVDIIQTHTAFDQQLLEETGGHPFEHLFSSQGLNEMEVDVLATFYEIPRLRWGVIVQQPVAGVFAPLERIERFAFFLFMGGIFTTIIVSLWFSSLLTRPIRILQRGTEIIEAGNFAHRVIVRTHDEIEQLAGAFNKMAESVERVIVREKRLERLKSEFVTIAAHQLRTPLSGIKWNVRMMLDGDFGPLTQKQRDSFFKTERANERMIRLVDDLLDLTKIEEGRYVRELVSTDIQSLIQEVIDPHRQMLRKKRITIEFLKPQKPLPQIRIDVEKMKIAFQNILENAMEYTLPGGSITVSLKENHQHIEVSVRDTGIGIPEEQKLKMFQKFSRGENAKKLQPVGSGLGLFIAKNIIEAHHGNIWLESEEGKGTIFFFTLPISRRMR